MEIKYKSSIIRQIYLPFLNKETILSILKYMTLYSMILNLKIYLKVQDSESSDQKEESISDR